MTEKKSQKIGKYEILEKLGEGGFGIVYKAMDTTLDRLVALKQLKLELSSSPEYLERFKRESRLMGSLNHPNIVKIMDVFEQDGRNLIVMDFMPNGSLEDKLDRETPLSLLNTLEILLPIAKAIDYAHSKHLIHRDIKPSNILFMEGDEPALSDFGLVKSLEINGTTTTGVSLGTPEYMSPEQILGKDLTTSSDIYSLGIVTYQMLTSEVPFSGNTPFEIQEGHVHKKPIDILEKNKNLPNEFSIFFEKVLDKKPENRYMTAQEFIRQLESASKIHIEKTYDQQLNLIQGRIDKKEFQSANTLLDDFLKINSTAKLIELQKECQRREHIWFQITELEKQIKKSRDQILELSKNEDWITEERHIEPLSDQPKIDNKNLKKEKEIKETKETRRIIFWIGTAFLALIIGAIEVSNFTGYALAIGIMIELFFSVILFWNEINEK